MLTQFRHQASHRHLRVICAAVLVAISCAAEPEEDIRGPRELIEIPAPPVADYSAWWIAGGVIAFLALAYLSWKWWKKSHTPPTAYAIALQALKALPLDRPDESFANDVSAILRRYIQQRHSIAATQRSTEEFLAEISNDSTLGTQQEKLREFLQSCDRAKFANSPLSKENRRDLVEQARVFVLETSQPLATPP
jgi:Domain of unknown function (DUF4381)